MIRGAAGCEHVTLSPELLGMGEPPAGRRDWRRQVASADFFFFSASVHQKTGGNEMCMLSRPPFISDFAF